MRDGDCVRQLGDDRHCFGPGHATIAFDPVRERAVRHVLHDDVRLIHHREPRRVHRHDVRVDRERAQDLALTGVAVPQRRFGSHGEDANRDRAADVSLQRPEHAAVATRAELDAIVEPVDAEIDAVLHRRHAQSSWNCRKSIVRAHACWVAASS